MADHIELAEKNLKMVYAESCENCAYHDPDYRYANTRYSCKVTSGDCPPTGRGDECPFTLYQERKDTLYATQALRPS